MAELGDFDDGAYGDYEDESQFYFKPASSTVLPKLVTTIVTNCLNATTIGDGGLNGNGGDGGVYNGGDDLNGAGGLILGGITGTYYYNATTLCSDIGPDLSLLDDESNFVNGYIFIGLILGVVILATIIGNVFVLAAIQRERNLNSNVGNLLILSLAVADLFVACLVMPLGAYKEVTKHWYLGAKMCDMWTSSDVLSCSASILHLVAIALDRYWAVTSIDYIHHRSKKRILTMVGIIWVISFLISVSPLFGWKDDGWDDRVSKEYICGVSQSVSYQIFATLSSFYVPLAVVLFLYARIYETARKRIRRRPTKAPTGGGGGGGGGGAGLLPPEATTTTSLINSPSPEKASLLMNNGRSGNSSTGPTPESTPLRVIHKSGAGGGGSGMSATVKTKRETTEAKRERKAAKTLAIITGVFIICWLPFFVMAPTMAVCPECPMTDTVSSILLWLGYFNSTLNPIIYNIFNPEFRLAFKKILFGRNYVARHGGGSGGGVAV